MSGKVSPLAPKTQPRMPAIEGVRIATAEAGIKYRGRTDLMLMTFEPGTTVAGVLTRSRCPSAPVDFCRANLPGGQARALVVNSGNANAFTGRRGREATRLTGEAAAAAAGCRAEEVFLASTGVIGEPLAAERFSHLLVDMARSASAERWDEAGRAIMTHRHVPQIRDGHGQARRRRGDDQRHRQGRRDDRARHGDHALFRGHGCADRRRPRCRPCSPRAVGGTFNAVTVDSDTSTSDTLLLFATGAAARRGVPRIEEAGDKRLVAFRRALNQVLQSLALQVVRDGEGARKQIEVTVTGAQSSRSAKRIALSIANSPLVKTAVAGEDANWGRVVMAVGKAGEPADRDRLSIWFGPNRVAHHGERDPGYSEEATSAYMRNDEIRIAADLGLGRGKATVWTCDLTKEYVEINGDYRS